MKKKEPAEMVSLNESLFSLDDENLTVEVLDQRLEMVMVQDSFDCGVFTCSSFATCADFGCTTFEVG